MRLPEPLLSTDDHAAVDLLRTYYGHYTGRHFNERSAQLGDEFTPDDLVAVTYLSVHVPGEAGRQLLVDRRSELIGLLEQVGSDRDLVDVAETIDQDWPGRVLNRALRSLPGVGDVTSSKLCARLRPRLLPIWDSVIADVTGCQKEYWNPLREALRADNGSLKARLERIRSHAGLPQTISAIRTFDVITWMTGKAEGRVRDQATIGG